MEGDNAVTNANRTIPFPTDLLLYTQGDSTGGDMVFVAPSAGGSLSGIYAFTQTVFVGDPSGDTDNNIYTSANLATALGSFSDPGILYSLSGTNVTLKTNASIEYGSNVDIDGNVTTSGTGGIAYVGNTANVTAADPVLTSVSTINFLSGSIIGNNNALTIDTSGTAAFGVFGGGDINGLTALNQNGSGTLTLDSSNSTYTGTTNINAGTLKLGAANAVPSGSNVTMAAGTVFNLNNFSDTIGSLSGSGSVTLGSGTLTTGDTIDTTYSGIISGSGGLTKQGADNFTLSGANTYTGATSINSGTLSISNANGLGNSGTHTSGVSVASGTTLNIDGVVIAAPVPLTLNGSTLSSTGVATFSGPITLTSATNNNFISGTAGDAFTIGGVTNGAANLTFSGPGTFNLANDFGTTTALTSITGNADLNLSGTTMETSGDQTYNNPITLSADSDFISTGGALDFASTIDGDFNLVTNSNTVTTFAGNIGATTALASLDATASAIDINATDIFTDGTQTYHSPVTLGTSPTIKSGAGAITFDSTVSGATETLSLQDNTSASTGAVTFDGNVTLAGLTTFGGAANYAVSLLGTGTNTITNAVSFLNTNGVTLGGGGTFDFNGGLTSTASTTTLDGTINSNDNAIDLNAVTVSGNSQLNSAGGAITIGATNSNATGTHNLTLTSGAGLITLNGAIGGTTSLAQFSATETGANNLTLANNITTATSINLSTGGTLSESSGILSTGLLTTTSVGGTTLNNNNAISSFDPTNTSSGNISLTNLNATDANWILTS